MTAEIPKSPESESPKYESLSEAQKELLKNQFGIEDAETYTFAMEASITEGENPFTPEEIRKYLKQAAENEK